MRVSAESIDTGAARVSPEPCSGLTIWLKTHVVAASLIVLFCSASVRVVGVLRADVNELVAQYSDAPTYFTPAQSMIDRGAFLNNRGQPMISRTPGYPAFLAGIMLVVGRDLRAVLISQTIILSFGPLILYLLARRILPPAVALIGGLMAAFSPWGAVLAVAPMSDGLFLFLLILLFFVMNFVGWLRGIRAILGSACVGLLTGMAVLVRPIWPLVLLVPAAFLFSCGLKQKQVWLLVVTILVSAATPVALWKERNQREARFNGISDIPGQTVWLYLAARVRAEVNGQDRHAVSTLAYQEEHSWGLPISSQEADNERWRRAKAVFSEHPLVTIYSFGRSAFEHAIHPSPDVLRAMKLSFPGDIVLLAVLWGGMLLASAYALWRAISDPVSKDGYFDWRHLVAMLVVCAALTLSSGISFAAGSRLRAPLEAVVPLLAAVGLVRAIRAFSSNGGANNCKQYV